MSNPPIDPFPTLAELMDRRTHMDLMALLILFVRNHEGSAREEQHEAATKLAEQIVQGFGVLSAHARARLRNSEEALREIRMLLPPAPVVMRDQGKVALFKPPEPERMLYLIFQALNKYDDAFAKEAEQAFSKQEHS